MDKDGQDIADLINDIEDLEEECQELIESL